MFKVIIAGGRDFKNYDYLKECCNKALSNQANIQIVCGMAKGTDLLGKRYGDEFGYPVAEFPADWDGIGKKAGFVRNEQMADYGNALIAFWDGSSKGTAHMIDLATKKGLKVKIYKY